MRHRGVKGYVRLSQSPAQHAVILRTPLLKGRAIPILEVLFDISSAEEPRRRRPIPSGESPVCRVEAAQGELAKAPCVHRHWHRCFTFYRPFPAVVCLPAASWLQWASALRRDRLRLTALGTCGVASGFRLAVTFRRAGLFAASPRWQRQCIPIGNIVKKYFLKEFFRVKLFCQAKQGKKVPPKRA